MACPPARCTCVDADWSGAPPGNWMVSRWHSCQSWWQFIYSTLLPGLGSWLRFLLSQQVSRWKERGRHSTGAEGWSFCRASPCPPLTALRAGFPPGHAPRCQEGVPAGGLPSSRLELSGNSSPTSVQACEMGTASLTEL